MRTRITRSKIGRNQKEPYQLRQDSFTRTLYENEKINSFLITLRKYKDSVAKRNYCCEHGQKCGEFIKI